MRGIKPSLALASLAVIGLALLASARQDRAGGLMARAADRWLASLTADQKTAASFDFDDKERLNWHFIPRPRKGLAFKEMAPEQRALAFGLIESGVGAEGALKATTIMSLEQVLKDLEKGSGPVRDPELYYLSIFGKPSNKGKWGWRVEGHHLSLNLTMEDGKIVAATPAFFGANPADVKQGPRAGLRTLADREDRALRLVQALDDGQKKKAIVDEKAPGDVRSANTPEPPRDAAVGIAYADLREDQKGLLKELVETYTEDMPPEVATAWISEIKKTGVENVKFAWFGAQDRSQGHAYRIQGPTFLIEFNNTQNNANHVHSFWRNMLGDFGIPLAAR
jgi:hypothetical protein